MDYGMDKKKKKKMMYGGTARKKMMGGGMSGMKRKNMKHGGPHNNMDRVGMAMGGAMDVQEPN